MLHSVDLLLLDPVFQNRIWGGRKLNMYGYDLPTGDIGECWGISAHPNGDCTIASGPLAGELLSSVWERHPDLFGRTSDHAFPFIIKILDAESDLSVQVHPDDAYAESHEHGSLGKTECWYVIDCEEGADIVVGQRTASRRELLTAIETGRWDEILNVIPVHPGDFFQIEPGTVHAIRRGTLILETQQSSDITYRLYDYDRIQDDGNPRELHIEQSLDVINYDAELPNNGRVRAKEVNGITHLIDCPQYSVDRIECRGETTYPVATAGISFLCVSVISGGGVVNSVPVKAGCHFIATSNCRNLELSGGMTLIVSHT